jgi:hypothetical protein
MNTSIVSKLNIKKNDFVTLPRKVYESLLRTNTKLQKDWIYEEPISNFLKKRINSAETALKKGKTTTWNFK